MNLINDCCVNTTELISFTDIINVFNSSSSALSAFKNYGEAFNKKIDWISRNPEDNVIQLAQYCPENGNTDTYLYEWYLNYINRSGICN